ncbi:hypothetical protein [Jeotgalicoccus sp. S0W5]|uniref:hypothetical protein n=1 Tax=Jeotgalicoccus sp. S0W5 TaxID=2527874 RepID=UPI001414F3AF|nr:hypothetical protein [Jeotgalicoccus sp. S0W5]
MNNKAQLNGVRLPLTNLENCRELGGYETGKDSRLIYTIFLKKLLYPINSHNLYVHYVYLYLFIYTNYFILYYCYLYNKTLLFQSLSYTKIEINFHNLHIKMS